ncbi:glutaminase [Epibacterium ulvae]|uniref:glutaminase n=1 Tax=Epibacterium ulvae TaxID=1156985 RepID=UPI003340A48C
MRRINAVMFTCGHYDGSSDIAYHISLPGKSGGGILVIAPRSRLNRGLAARSERAGQFPTGRSLR